MGALVDPVRDALQSTADKWLHRLLLSTVIVAIGVAFEAPEATAILARWYKLRFNKEVGQPNEKSWVIPAAYLGLLLVIGGIVAEGIFEARLSNADTALRAYDDQILADATKNSGDAKDSAKQAKDAADSAKGAADDAETKTKAAAGEMAEAANEASKARRVSSDALGKVNGAVERANAAEQQAIHLRDILGGWQLDEKNKAKFIARLKGFSGTQFDLAVNPMESEFMEELDGVLTSPSVGWVRLPPKTDPSLPISMSLDNKATIMFTSGILFEVDSDQQNALMPATLALGQSLHEEVGVEHIKVNLVPPGSWGKRIHIIIGKRDK